MDCVCSSPTTNRDSSAGSFRAFTKSSTAWSAASVYESFGTGQVCGKKSTELIILSVRVSGT